MIQIKLKKSFHESFWRCAWSVVSQDVHKWDKNFNDLKFDKNQNQQIYFIKVQPYHKNIQQTKTVTLKSESDINIIIIS